MRDLDADGRAWTRPRRSSRHCLLIQAQLAGLRADVVASVTFSIQHDRIVRGRTDHDHLMMHGCGAGIDHGSRVTKRLIKIRNEKRKRTKRI